MKQLLTTIAAVVLVGCSKPPPPDISIHEAAEKGNIEAVKQHIAAGTDVNGKSTAAPTPLFFSVRYGQKEVAELLIKEGAEVNAKDNYGETPLTYAFDNKEIVEMLISNGANVNTRGEENITPLMHSVAASASNIDEAAFQICELLIEKGADVNAKDDNKWTPLHYAAAKRHKEIITLLIANGAHVNAKDDDGDTPLNYAEFENDKDIADLLRKHSGKTAEELNAELGLNQQSSEKEKIQNFGINATPLHIAVFSEDVKGIEILIAKGANINAKDNRGWTPLDRAEGNDKLINLLRKHGGKTGEELKAEGK